MIKNAKGVHEGFIASPCLFKLNSEYIMRNAGLDEINPEYSLEGMTLKL